MFRIVLCGLTRLFQAETAIIILNILSILFEFFLILFNLPILQLPWEESFYARFKSRWFQEQIYN
jgi:hypothetical protein